MTEPNHWMNRAPDMLRDLEGPDGEPLATHFDRRWLWRLEGFLAVNGTTEYHHKMRADLYQYLCETCEHVWRDLGDLTPTPSVQCLWCNTVREVSSFPAGEVPDDRA
ncbi:hypothetical protein [Nocardia sp. NPDC004260]